MSAAADVAGLKPAVSFLKTAENGAPYLAGSKCKKCGEVFVGTRDTCAKCFTRGQMDHIHLADTGRLYNFTVVHRNFPGVPVPFISVIVDLDGGGTLKGNLLDVEPDPAKIKFDMPVKVVYRNAGRKDKEGNGYFAYFFTPANKN
ncbi:MAG: OB-fold domain-containing protein [Proteobacteria bacterium]|nr:OB-fold domain-containing protein [Pseudomonadota bacterium]